MRWDEPFHPSALARAGEASKIGRTPVDGWSLVSVTSVHSPEHESPSPRVGAALFAHTEAFGGYQGLTGHHFETRLPPHVHSSYVLGVIDEGALLVTVKGTSVVATPGMVLLLPPFAVHTEHPLTPGGWSFRYLYPTEAVVREALNIAPGPGPALRFAHAVLADAALARGIARVHDGLRGGEREGTAADALIGLLRYLRDHHCRSDREPRRASMERRNVLAVRDLLTERPLRSVRLSDLAGAAHLSPFHFTRVFKAAIGLPPYAYYEQVRIAFAHQLIHQGHELTSVAYQLGYADQSHLTRHFRRGSFTTPGRMALLTRNARHHPESIGSRDAWPPARHLAGTRDMTSEDASPPSG